MATVNGRQSYVAKTGDTMSGTLTLASPAQIAMSAGIIDGINRVNFDNNGFFGVGGSGYISFNTAVGVIVTKRIALTVGGGWIGSYSTAEVALPIRGRTGQTADLTQWQTNDAGSVDSVVDNAGKFGIGVTDPDERIHLSGNFKINDTGNVILGTSTGTKVGTSVSQKIGFWNATPIVQPSSANQAALTNSTGGSGDGTLVDVTTAMLADPVKINDNFTDIATLLNQLRLDLVSTGIIKGSV